VVGPLKPVNLLLIVLTAKQYSEATQNIARLGSQQEAHLGKASPNRIDCKNRCKTVAPSTPPIKPPNKLQTSSAGVSMSPLSKGSILTPALLV
jgi:hypothetical protein